MKLFIVEKEAAAGFRSGSLYCNELVDARTGVVE